MKLEISDNMYITENKISGYELHVLYEKDTSHPLVKEPGTKEEVYYYGKLSQALDRATEFVVNESFRGPLIEYIHFYKKTREELSVP